MSTQIGDEVVIMSAGLHQPVREGEIRGVSEDPGGVVYFVRWADTGQESLLRPGPDVVIKRRHGRGSGAVAAGATPWLSRLRHPLEWHHNRDLERRQQVREEHFARRVRTSSPGSG